ncbi:MAG: divergent polysaccharide deacetylase family protein [Desulfobacterium sp.]
MRRKVQKTRQKNGKIPLPFVDLESKKGFLFLVGLISLVFFVALAAMGIYFYIDHGELPKKPGGSHATVLTSDGQSRKHSLAPGPEDSFAPGTDIHNKVALQGLDQQDLPGKADPIHPEVPSSELINEKAVEEINTLPLTYNEPGTGGGQDNRPLYEVFDKDSSPSFGRGDVPGPEGKEGLPRVAIIIDDVGFDKAMAMAFSRLNPHITMAILPESPFGRAIADRLYVRDVEIMLHLPMEPMQYPEVNPGPGALMADMPPDLLLETLRRDLDCIPYVKGVNNHMGSRLTTLSDQMRQVFTVLKKRDLFFIDSLTARHSICRDSARLFQLAFAQRDVFLDNIQDKNYITGQINELIQISQLHGFAIAIGHPYPVTLETLALLLPEMQEKVSIVRASELAVRPNL